MPPSAWRSTSTERLAPRCTRAYNFASSQYNAASGDLPPVDRDKLRKRRARILERFDAQKWYDDLCRDVHRWKPVEGGERGPRTTIWEGEWKNTMAVDIGYPRPPADLIL